MPVLAFNQPVSVRNNFFFLSRYLNVNVIVTLEFKLILSRHGSAQSISTISGLTTYCDLIPLLLTVVVQGYKVDLSSAVGFVPHTIPFQTSSVVWPS